MKTCSDCKLYLSFDQFYTNPSRADGFANLCKLCSKLRAKKRIEENRIKNKNNQFDSNSKKYCSNCNIEKLKSDFTKNICTSDGCSIHCKKCINLLRDDKKYKEYYNNNRDKIIAQKVLYYRNRWKTDENYRILSNIRRRINHFIKKEDKSCSSREILGCDLDFFKNYISNLFTDGMSWENYGEWQLDHKKPCSLYDFKDPEQQKECFHYTNLQPLWTIDNILKSNKVIDM